jgi:hypothetical protein
VVEFGVPVVLATKVVLEAAVPAAEQPQVAPASVAGVRAQGRRVGGGGDGEVDGLRWMRATPLNPSIHMVHIGQGLVCRLPYIRW